MTSPQKEIVENQRTPNIFEHTFKIVELYTEYMNMYGDTGNSLVLKKRFKMYGLKSEIVTHDVGDSFADDADILVAGGGQDSGQLKILNDLHQNGAKIKQMSKNDVPMLVICGMYQLFGKYFKTHTGGNLEGLGIFDAYTIGKDERIIGNIITETSRFGTLVGYENHSGQTYLEDSTNTFPLAKNIKLGVGNRIGANTEGCISKNTIGTYLHGPLLPKNPQISDFLINAAVKNFTGKSIQLTSDHVKKIDDVAYLAKQQVTLR